MFRFGPTKTEWADWMHYQLLLTKLDLWNRTDSLIVGVFLNRMEEVFEIRY